MKFSSLTALAGADPGADLEKLLLNGGNGLLDIVGYAGGVIVVLGLGKLILSFQTEDPNGKAQGVTILLAGTFLVAIKPIMEGLGAL